MRRFLKAKKELPRDLFKQVQKHARGCYLWVPNDTKKEQRRRNDYIVNLYFEQGISAKEIARMVYLSPSRVWQIIAEWRKRNPDEI